MRFFLIGLAQRPARTYNARSDTDLDCFNCDASRSAAGRLQRSGETPAMMIPISAAVPITHNSEIFQRARPMNDSNAISAVGQSITARAAITYAAPAMAPVAAADTPSTKPFTTG